MFKRVSESAHSVLFHSADLGTFFLQVQGASQLGTATTVNDLGALDQVTHRAQGIVDGTLGLVDDLVRTTSDEDGQGLGLGALLDDQHALVGGAEVQFADLAGETQLFGADFLEAGDDAGTGGHGQQLDVDAAHPADSRQLVL